jgi:anaerobic magnesium-protoporphyrin IX monomethyl ester cyclase
MMHEPKVLVISGGFLSEKETSVTRALRKQSIQWSASTASWLDLKVKLILAEPLIASNWRAKRGNRPATVREFFSHNDNLVTPELAETVLLTLLRDAGLQFSRATIDDVFAEPAWLDRELSECCCVFLSTTLLRDLSELEPIVERLRRPGVRIVIGGALVGLLAPDWQGFAGVDLAAIGYGEILVPVISDWIRGGFEQLRAPRGGRMARRKFTTFLWSGVPHGRSLDFLSSPDWSLAERVHGRRFPMVYYESVRGCPYRCNFCNYPYLFDDTKFRYKSAMRIADDWEKISQETGAEYITCLDSLFTIPRARLVSLCDLLIRRGIKTKWICYARADDLAQPDIAPMMKDAGAIQVQIGIESGDQGQLDNMDKQCSVESNIAALHNCRRAGITSAVSLIVGFPGETRQTLANTYQFLTLAPPDFYFLATFSTRAYNVPVLNARNRERFRLSTQSNQRTVAPYWTHSSMSCDEAGDHVRAMHEKLMLNKISLNSALFYSGILKYHPDQREALLDYQASLMRPSALKWLFDRGHAFVNWRLKKDVKHWMDSQDPQQWPSSTMGVSAPKT